LQTLSEYSLLSEDGLIVAEHPKADHLPERIGNLNAYRRLEYGDTAITLLK
jgi:16S rRNA G966 N2-methylase RsmD